MGNDVEDIYRKWESAIGMTQMGNINDIDMEHHGSFHLLTSSNLYNTDMEIWNLEDHPTLQLVSK